MTDDGTHSQAVGVLGVPHPVCSAGGEAAAPVFIRPGGEGTSGRMSGNGASSKPTQSGVPRGEVTGSVSRRLSPPNATVSTLVTPASRFHLFRIYVLIHEVGPAAVPCPSPQAGERAAPPLRPGPEPPEASKG